MLKRLAPALLLTACATTSPRFSQEVASSFAHDDMRRLESASLVVYYPGQYRDAAVQAAARVEQCLETLRTHEPTQRPHDKGLLFLTSANFNNAYVTGQYSGEPLHSVLPLFATDEAFHFYGLPVTQVGDIGCHEMLHLVHFEQVENFWRIVNAVFGPVEPSQAFIERWFTEGVAQFYEGRLGRKLGRPHSPLYRGTFDSIVDAHQGKLGPGELSMLQRELYPASGAYLTSLPFVEWLAQEHGEDKLWEVMDAQGRSFFTVFGVTLRFHAVYGRDIGDLVADWSAYLVEHRAHRVRPAEQRVLRPELGYLARLATHPRTGTVALLTTGTDEGPRLRILEQDGTVRVERTLIQMGTDRDWILAGPGSMSGLSFTGDGRWLFVFNDDFGAVGDTRGQVWKIDADTGDVVKVWHEVGYGMGGAVRPDGSAYTYVGVAPGRTWLAELDLRTGTTHTLYELPAGLTAAAPAWSPDGAQLVFSRFDPEGWNLWLWSPQDGARALTRDGAFNYGAHWEDPGHLLLSRENEGRLQAHRLTLAHGVLDRVSEAPWAVMDVAALNGAVAFINRDGAQWSLDVVPGTLAGPATLAPAPEVQTAAAPPPAPKIKSDEPYGATDHLFVPQLRLPGLSAFLDTDETGQPRVGTNLYLSLAGRDRLARHSWALNGMLALPTKNSDVSVEYLNEQLAPWALGVALGRTQTTADTLWGAAATASRDFFTTPLSLGFRTLVRQSPGRLERFVGPSFAIAWSAGESTPYGGTQRLLSLSFSAAAYPKAFGSSFNLGDFSGGIAVAVPPPLYRRASLVLGLSMRALPGAPDDVLKVGGDAGSSLWLSRDSDPAPTAVDRLVPGSLTVAVRGYEDHAIRASSLQTLSARYRANLIIDRGFASTFWIFPSIFFRQVDLTLFANATHARTPDDVWLRAVGAQASLRLAFAGAAPVSLTYQYAWRYDQALPPLHVVNLTFD